MTENKIVRDKMPLVSVVVPIYNVELYLKECVDSILSQTYKNIEVILVDDESPDLCGKICDDYAAMDGRIKVVHKKNGGLSDARNAGMKVATGDLITFVDSDDYMLSFNYGNHVVCNSPDWCCCCNSDFSTYQRE